MPHDKHRDIVVAEGLYIRGLRPNREIPSIARARARRRADRASLHTADSQRSCREDLSQTADRHADSSTQALPKRNNCRVAAYYQAPTYSCRDVLDHPPVNCAPTCPKTDPARNLPHCPCSSTQTKDGSRKGFNSLAAFCPRTTS